MVQTADYARASHRLSHIGEVDTADGRAQRFDALRNSAPWLMCRGLPRSGSASDCTMALQPFMVPPVIANPLFSGPSSPWKPTSISAYTYDGMPLLSKREAIRLGLSPGHSDWLINLQETLKWSKIHSMLGRTSDHLFSLNGRSDRGSKADEAPVH